MLQGEYLVEAVRSERFARRFWRKVHKTDGCWLWMAARNPKGYGRIGVGGAGDGDALAHRASWIIANGAIAEGLHVCHHCDTPACVNPGHLFLGTDAANQADSIAKGRNANGAKQGSAVLTSAQVIEIRARLARGASQRGLAREYGVSFQLIFRIGRREIWRHVQQPPTNPETL